MQLHCGPPVGLQAQRGGVAAVRVLAAGPCTRRHRGHAAVTTAAATVTAPERPPVQPTPKPLVSTLHKLSFDRDSLPSLADPSRFRDAEQQFLQLLRTPDLDKQFRDDPELQQAATALEAAVDEAIRIAYAKPQQAHTEAHSEAAVSAAHLFLQRTLYRINRLAFFWFDDMENYSNDRSIYLAQLRDRIEEPWQAWELTHMPVAEYKQLSPEQIKQRLQEGYRVDVDPPLSDGARYMRGDMSLQGYRHLLAVASVDGLVEASRQSRVCAGAANDVACMIFRVLMEEYGTGRYNKKHSTFFAQMMQELGLRREVEWYFDLVPWQSLASMNQNFILTERRRHYLRYAGGLCYFEVAGPAIYRTYLAAAERLGLSAESSGYWELHITEDERHGRQMVEDVALPLVDRYPDNAWEVLLGYDQERFQGARAGATLVQDLKAVDRLQHTPADDIC